MTLVTVKVKLHTEITSTKFSKNTVEDLSDFEPFLDFWYRWSGESSYFVPPDKKKASYVERTLKPILKTTKFKIETSSSKVLYRLVEYDPKLIVGSTLTIKPRDEVQSWTSLSDERALKKLAGVLGFDKYTLLQGRKGKALVTPKFVQDVEGWIVENYKYLKIDTMMRSFTTALTLRYEDKEHLLDLRSPPKVTIVGIIEP